MGGWVGGSAQIPGGQFDPPPPPSSITKQRPGPVGIADGLRRPAPRSPATHRRTIDGGRQALGHGPAHPRLPLPGAGHGAPTPSEPSPPPPPEGPMGNRPFGAPLRKGGDPVQCTKGTRATLPHTPRARGLGGYSGGGGGHRNTVRQAMDGLWTEVCGQQKQSNDPRQQPAHPQYANYWAPLTRKRHIPPHSAQPRHTNYWAPRTRKRPQQEHRPQRPTERSDPTQHAEGRTGDCPGPRKGATTRRNVTQGGGRGTSRRGDLCDYYLWTEATPNQQMVRNLIDETASPAVAPRPPLPRDALDVRGPQRRPQRRLDRRLEEVAKATGAVTVGYKCR